MYCVLVAQHNNAHCTFVRKLAICSSSHLWRIYFKNYLDGYLT